ncbi:hypothetical protein ACE1ET_13470 [Saccharicrinis sp. FJH62]|uniref:hypothetical protein n=1 Tax=Saccharicrinis sp. FJH62 TaxID=3344657 RepID=UPI0035D441CD
MKRFFLIFFCSIILSVAGFSQEAYRIHSDFLFKSKGLDSLFRVTKGEVFFDKNIKTLVFKNTFPKRETYVIKDTLLYVYHGDTLMETRKNIIPPEHTMFSYLLSSTFANYGLESAGFQINNVEKKKGIVVTSWLPSGIIGKYVGKILVANKDKRLYSVVIYDKDMKILSRQIFKKYESIDGTEIPSEILSVTYYNDSSQYMQITNLANIKLNESSNESLYNFKIPDL